MISGVILKMLNLLLKEYMKTNTAVLEGQRISEGGRYWSGNKNFLAYMYIRHGRIFCQFSK